MADNIVGQIALELGVNTDDFKKQLRSLGKTTKSSIGGVTDVLKKVAPAVAAAFSVKAIVNFSKECLSLGSDLAEVQNVVDVTFGSMSGAVDEWAKNAMTSFGMSEKVAKEYMGQFGAMSKAFGNTEQMAYDQATALTGLAGDVASFYNMTTEEAFTKLKAVYTGETEGLKALGVVMTQTALDEYAMANGFGKTTKAMSEQEKVALRLAFVTDRLSGASGDFARTADGWANQTRVLALRFDAIKASIGQGLINALLPVVRVLNTILERLQVVADAFSDFMSNLFGDAGSMSSAVGSAASGTGAISSNLGDAASSAKAIKKTLAGFDQLNILSSGSDDSSSGATSGGTSGGASTITPTIEEPTIASGAAAKVLEWINSLPKLKFDVDWEAVGSNMKNGFLNLWESVKDWAHFVLTISINIINDLGLDNLITKLSELWLAFTELIQSITEVLTPALTTFYEEAISPVVKWIGEKLAEAIQLVIDLFKDLGQWITDNKDGVVAAFGAIAAGLAAYKVALGITTLIDEFKSGTIGASVAQWALNAAMNANPIALLVAALAALVAGFIILWNNCEGFRNFFINMWEAIKTAFQAFVDFMSPAIEAIKGFFVSLWQKMTEIWNAISQSLTPLVNEIVGAFQMAWDVIKLIWSYVQPFFAGIWEGIKSIFSIVGEWFKLIFGIAWEEIKAIWSVVVAWFTLLWENIKAVFSVVGEWFKGIFNIAWEAIKAIWNSVVAYFEMVWAGIKAVFAVVKGVLSGDFTDAWDAIKNVWDKAQKYFDSIWDGIKNIFGAVGDYFKNTFSAAWEAIQKVFSNFGTFFSGLWDTIKNTFSAIGTKIGDAIGDSVKAGINGVIASVEGIVNTFIKTINGAITLINKIPGVNIGKLNEIDIPRLATGGYVAANTPQLAIIGDNKREGEIVAPESKITEAVMAAFRQFLPLFNNGGNNKPIYLTIKLGDGTFWEGFVDYHNDIVKRTGDTPLLV